MKVRAKANGNDYDLPDEEANARLATGLFEKVEADNPVEGEGDESDKEAGATEQPRVNRPYKRRDLTAED